MKVLSNLSSDFKISPYSDLYLLLHWILDCLWLINEYNLSEINYLDQISDFDMNQTRIISGLLWYLKNLYLNYKNKIVLQINVTLRKGGMFDILKIHFSITFWVHIQLYMDMVILFRCISNNDGFRKIIICV